MKILRIVTERRMTEQEWEWYKEDMTAAQMACNFQILEREGKYKFTQTARPDERVETVYTLETKPE